MFYADIQYDAAFQGFLRKITVNSLRIGTKETHEFFYIACRLYWNGTVKSHFFLTQFLTHFLFYTNLRVWVFKCKLQIRVGGGPDSYSKTSQVNSSCLDASYEHARACSTQSPKRILPLSYFILQPERGYNSLRIRTKETHEIFYIACRLYWNSTVKEKKYRSWALKFVYTIGINSTKISNMQFY